MCSRRWSVHALVGGRHRYWKRCTNEADHSQPLACHSMVSIFGGVHRAMPQGQTDIFQNIKIVKCNWIFWLVFQSNHSILDCHINRKFIDYKSFTGQYLTLTSHYSRADLPFTDSWCSLDIYMVRNLHLDILKAPWCVLFLISKIQHIFRDIESYLQKLVQKV